MWGCSVAFFFFGLNSNGDAVKKGFNVIEKLNRALVCDRANWDEAGKTGVVMWSSNLR